jgi:DNA-binding NarL/FixJ family response regulator
MSVRILVVDDHPVVRKGIRSLLSNYDDFEVVGEADDPPGALAAFARLRPDLVLLDIRLGGGSGLEVLDGILGMEPTAKVLMLSSFDDEEYVHRSLEAGAMGYVLKGDSDSVLVAALRTAVEGRHVLSPQVTDQLVSRIYLGQDRPEFDETDREILRLLAAGASNAEIAERLFISDSTVKRRLRSVFSRLGVQRRTEAAAEAVRRGLI